MSWTVFLDRDGTLVPDRRYATHPDQLEPYDGAVEALAALHEAGAHLAVVSNQSAVARGMMDTQGLELMDATLRGLFAPVPFAGTYYCPHHPDFTGSCACRKPQPGLILQGLKEIGSSPRNSYVVGDTAADMEAGRRAGLRTVLVLTGYGRRDYEKVGRERLADKVARNVATAVSWILNDRRPQP